MPRVAHLKYDRIASGIRSHRVWNNIASHLEQYRLASPRYDELFGDKAPGSVSARLVGIAAAWGAWNRLALGACGDGYSFFAKGDDP